jgi:hippurate hydrolase
MSNDKNAAQMTTLICGFSRVVAAVKSGKIRFLLAAGIVFQALWGSTIALAAPAPATITMIQKQLDQDYPHLDSVYRDLHAHPELGFKEIRTSAVLARELRGLGYDVTTGVGVTGVVAILQNGPGPTIMIRTDMDGLPMQEMSGLPYASAIRSTANGKETFVAHSCGHDIHMTVWVGVARVLAQTRTQWSGTVMFVGQPSEEGDSGAKAMIDDGIFLRFLKPDFGFALHVMSSPHGQVGYRAGSMSSNGDSLDIIFHGRGGHGSTPQRTIDPVMQATRFVVDVQAVISREKDPHAFGVISIGSIHAGNAGNVIPDNATLSGTIRSFDAAVRERMLDGIERTARGVALISGAPAPDVAIRSIRKAIVNDAALTAKTVAVFQAAFGGNAVLLDAPFYGSEDYSEFIAAGVPSLFFTIGGGDPAAVAAAANGGPQLPDNHSPYFAPIPEPTIRTGVMAMSLAALNAMPRSGD